MPSPLPFAVCPKALFSLLSCYLLFFPSIVTPNIFLSILIWVDRILQPSDCVSAHVSAAYRRIGITPSMKILFFKASGNVLFCRYWLSFPNFPHVIATRSCTSFSWPPFACMCWPMYMYWSTWSRISLTTMIFDCVVLANSVLVFVLFIFKPIRRHFVCSSFTMACYSCGSFASRAISSANLRLFR